MTSALDHIQENASKYIVSNCACYEFGFCTSHHIKVRGCINCTDCVIKQITELCNDEKEQETDPLNSSGISLAQKIVDLFDIEEVK